MKAQQVYKLIREEKIIAIARGVKVDHVVNLAEALLAGGIRMLEVTCNTEGIFEMIKLLREKMADKMCIGAGDRNNDAISRKGDCSGRGIYYCAGYQYRDN